jgi:DhnA family fructose-bisphosphate aldolase class Ia
LALLGGRVVFIVSDHGGNVTNINRGSAKSRTAREMIAELYSLGEEHDFWFVAAWTPRECNQGPDRVAECASRAEALAACAKLGVTLEG